MIENISDQILGYSQEIRSHIKYFMKEGFSFEESSKIVELGIKAIERDNEHHKLRYAELGNQARERLLREREI